MYKIYLVEDDPVIAEALRRHLEQWGYEVRTAKDFQRIVEEFAAFCPQLVLLDISLPFYNGYHWCSEIRKLSQTPIIFISSASDNMNIVMAMNMGGDDFLPKPFDLEVVTAKVQALLRRTYSFSHQPEDASSRLMEHRGAVLNLADATLTYQGKPLSLTKNDFKILQMLLENKGRAVSREALMNRLWQSDCYIDDNTLTVNINRLRRKLDELGLEGFISTKKGIGYLIERE